MNICCTIACCTWHCGATVLSPSGRHLDSRADIQKDDDFKSATIFSHLEANIKCTNTWSTNDLIVAPVALQWYVPQRTISNHISSWSTNDLIVAPVALQWYVPHRTISDHISSWSTNGLIVAPVALQWYVPHRTISDHISSTCTNGSIVR